MKRSMPTVSKAIFLATMSHEIRTPLNAVVGMLDSLEATELDDRQTGYMQSASTAADTLLRLINDVLDFSKIEAGMLTLVQEPFNLCESIHSVLTATSVNAAAKGLDLYLNYAPDVPLSIIGDPIRMRPDSQQSGQQRSQIYRGGPCHTHRQSTYCRSNRRSTPV